MASRIGVLSLAVGALLCSGFGGRKQPEELPVPLASKYPAPAEGGKPKAGERVPYSRLPKAGSDSLWVTRSDGSLQCEPGTGMKLEAAREELVQAGVRVEDGYTTFDGARVRAQMCGMPAGTENGFLIPRADFTKASGLGYRELKTPG